LTFWTWINIKLSCSHFQLDSSQIAHIFNLMQLNSTENWVNSTRFVKNLSLTSRKLNIEIFPVFCFCITFLHYLFDRKSWRETWRKTWRKTWRETWRSFDKDHDEKHKEKHEDRLIESHDEKTWRSFDFDRKSWRKNMIESHEEKSCKLFNQAIYIYLISCWIESSFQIELLNQASQFNLSS